MDLEKLWKDKLEGLAWQVKKEFIMLLELMLKENVKSVLEIGCYKGGTALGFLEIGCDVTSVDILHRPEIDTVKAAYPDKFSFVFRDEIIDGFPQEFDMLFIDGDHSYLGCKQDFDEFYPYVKSGGLIVFHDILNNELHKKQGCEVYKVWQEVQNISAFEFIGNEGWGGIGGIFK